MPDECMQCLNDEFVELDRQVQGGVIMVEYKCTVCGELVVKEF